MKQYKFKVLFFVTVVVTIIILYFLIRPVSTVNEQELMSLKQSILKSTIHCYSVEGAYPPNISYIKKHYGLYFDDSKYIVIYDRFADNVLPNIFVSRID